MKPISTPRPVLRSRALIFGFLLLGVVSLQGQHARLHREPDAAVLLVRQDRCALKRVRAGSRDRRSIFFGGLAGITRPYSGNRPSISFDVKRMSPIWARTWLLPMARSTCLPLPNNALQLEDTLARHDDLLRRRMIRLSSSIRRKPDDGRQLQPFAATCRRIRAASRSGNSERPAAPSRNAVLSISRLRIGLRDRQRLLRRMSSTTGKSVAGSVDSVKRLLPDRIEARSPSIENRYLRFLRQCLQDIEQLASRHRDLARLLHGSPSSGGHQLDFEIRCP